MKDPWKRRIFGWNSRLKQRGSGFRITKEWLEQFQTCPYCLRELTAENAGLDHKMPLSLGGTDHHTNLHITCQECNRAKSSLTHPQFEALMRLLRNPPFDQKAKTMIMRKLKSAWRIQ